jgi:hypothetical protein
MTNDDKNENEAYPPAMTGFWDGLGSALVILALCLGIGGGVYILKN